MPTLILELIAIAAQAAQAYVKGTPKDLLAAAQALSTIAQKAIAAHGEIVGQLIDPNLIQPVPLDPGGPPQP
jgi:hypothetical protein